MLWRRDGAVFVDKVGLPTAVVADTVDLGRPTGRGATGPVWPAPAADGATVLVGGTGSRRAVGGVVSTAAAGIVGAAGMLGRDVAGTLCVRASGVISARGSSVGIGATAAFATSLRGCATLAKARLNVIL